MAGLIYGAYGYTGRLITDWAAEQGLNPIVAGRDRYKVETLAREYDLPHRTFALDRTSALESALDDVSCVLHCAGPFARTTAPMVSACLRTGTHYLDITGEIEVFEALHERDDGAREAGVMLCPGVGFDVVPTDSLAVHLHDAVPSATSLDIAFMGLGSVSRGTMKTAVEQLGQGGAVRREGRIVSVPPGWATRSVDFGASGPGVRTVVSIPWGDVATAYHSTGIPNITDYTYLPSTARRLLRWSRYLQWLFQLDVVKQLLRALVDRQPPGPSDEEREHGSTHVWARARNDEGAEATARLHGPEAYTFTARTAVAALARVLDGDATPGYQTPGTAFGPDFVLDVDGVTRETNPSS